MSNEILKGPEKRILISIATVAVAVSTHMFAVKPLNEKRTEIEKRVAEINTAGEAALSKIRNIQNMRAEFATVSNEVSILTNGFVVRQVLGSYPMEQTIYQIASKYNFHVIGCTELGKIPTPDSPPTVLPSKGSKNAKKNTKTATTHHFDRFQMDVRGEGSYWSVMRLLSDLEELNPFFGVVSIEITANDNKPELPSVQMRLEWPVDANPPPNSSKGK